MKTREKKRYCVFEGGIAKTLIAAFFFCVLTALFLTVFVADLEQFARESDLVSFLTAAKIIRYGEGKNLYNLDIQKKYQSLITSQDEVTLIPFRNLPILAPFYVPLSFFSTPSAYKIYTLVLIIITILISFFSKKAFKSTSGSYWSLLPFVFFPTFVAIFSGQNSTILVLAFLLVFYFLKRKESFSTGVMMGLLTIKFQYLVSLPFIYLIVKEKKQFLKGFFLFSSSIVLGSVAISGAGFLKGYLQMLVETEASAYSSRPETMFTLFSSLSQITSFTRQNLFLINLVFYLLTIWFYYRNYKKFSLEINFAVLMLLTLTFCVHGGNIDIALLILPLWLLIDVYRGSKRVSAGNIFTIFIIIFSTLLFGFELSFLFPFFFLLSVALLFKESNIKLAQK